MFVYTYQFVNEYVCMCARVCVSECVLGCEKTKHPNNKKTFKNNTQNQCHSTNNREFLSMSDIFHACSVHILRVRLCFVVECFFSLFCTFSLWPRVLLLLLFVWLFVCVLVCVLHSFTKIRRTMRKECQTLNA